MFSKACQIAQGFTRPVIISQRLDSGGVTCVMGSFIVLNRDGWIATAAHIVDPIRILALHKAEKSAHEERLAAIRANTSLSPSQRKRQIASEMATKNAQWFTHQSYLWALQPGAQNGTFHVDELADIAIGQLVGFDTSGVGNYPAFQDPRKDPMPGTSLCRLGFPFYGLQSSFDPTTETFTLQNFSPPPVFPNDGIRTRIVESSDATSNRKAKLIETSTPGLGGQSGGPLFDVDGAVWGIQVRTAFLELGFSPKKKDGNREIVEHQFMNVGWASHVTHLIDLMRTHNVDFRSV